MQDLLAECNEHNINERDFRDMFCARCHNKTCNRAGWANSIWDARMSTQVDRLLDNPFYASLGDPRYAKIRAMDFPDARRDAMKVHISEALGDWSIPTVDDVQLSGTGSNTASAVEQAVAALSTGKVAARPVAPVATPAPPVAPLVVAVAPPPLVVPTPRPYGNTNAPAAGIMVGGGPPPARVALVDQWAVPVPPKNIIAVGGTVVLGGKKPNG